MANLTNNSGQTFKTQITEEQDPTVTIDASTFTEALYRIFAADCTTVLVTASLTGGNISVVVGYKNEKINIGKMLKTKKPVYIEIRKQLAEVLSIKDDSELVYNSMIKNMESSSILMSLAWLRQKHFLISVECGLINKR